VRFELRIAGLDAIPDSNGVVQSPFMNHVKDVRVIDMAIVPAVHVLTVDKEKLTPIELNSVTLEPIKANKSTTSTT